MIALIFIFEIASCLPAFPDLVDVQERISLFEQIHINIRECPEEQLHVFLVISE